MAYHLTIPACVNLPGNPGDENELSGMPTSIVVDNIMSRTDEEIKTNLVVRRAPQGTD